MAKTLLAERFGLRVHKDTRDVPVYALVRDRGGVKGARAADGQGGGVMSMDNGWIRGEGVRTIAVAEALSQLVDRPVVDRTNLDQVLDFNLTWTPVERGAAGEPLSACPSSVQDLAKRFGFRLDNASCPSIFTAVREQLGLRLDAQQAPFEVLVVDAVQLPSEN